MKLDIPKENIKVFINLLTCLSKISEQVDCIIRPRPTKTKVDEEDITSINSINNTTAPIILKLYSVNSVQSAFIEFNLTSDFFVLVDDNDDDVDTLNHFHMVLPLKVLLHMIKSSTPGSSSHFFADELHLQVISNQNDTNVSSSNDMCSVIVHWCNEKYQFSKTVKLRAHVMERQIATFDQSVYSMVLKDANQIWYNSLNQFLSSSSSKDDHSEVSCCIDELEQDSSSGEKFYNLRLQSYSSVDQSSKGKRKDQIVTRMSVGLENFNECLLRERTKEPDFDMATISDDGATIVSPSTGTNRGTNVTQGSGTKPILEMTFNLKDCKSFVQFCQSSAQPLYIHLAEQGHPILFKSNAEQNRCDIQAVCLLATLDMGQRNHSTPTMTPSIPSSLENQGSLSSHTQTKRSYRVISQRTPEPEENAAMDPTRVSIRNPFRRSLSERSHRLYLSPSSPFPVGEEPVYNHSMVVSVSPSSQLDLFQSPTPPRETPVSRCADDDSATAPVSQNDAYPAQVPTKRPRYS